MARVSIIEEVMLQQHASDNFFDFLLNHSILFFVFNVASLCYIKKGSV